MTFTKSAVALALASMATLSSVAHAVPSLSFIIDGDTFAQPYSITNNSTGGESVLRFNLNLSTIPAGGPFCFDTVNGGPCNPNPQSPMAFSAINPGLVGFTGPASVVDGATVLDLFFNNFGVGKTFSWNIDVDSSTAVSVFGNNLIGATAFVDFSNGDRLLGSLQAVAGNDDAAAFTVTGVTRTNVPEPESLALIALGLLGLAATRKRA